MNIKDIKVTVLVVIGIIIIIAVAIYAFATDEEVVTDTVSSTVNTTNTIIATNESLDPPKVEELTVDEKTDAESRDQLRIQDINTIQSALQSFVDAIGYYPATIDEIIPDYLSELPTDPMPEKYEYIYTCIGVTDPCVLYDLSYTLEVGTDELPSGLNLVSPEEIATP